MPRSSPVAVPDKIFGLSLFLDFIDRCHSLGSLHPPPAAVTSFPIAGPVIAYGVVASIVYGIIYWICKMI